MECSDRFLEPSPLRQCDTQVIVSLDQVGPELERVAILRDGFVEISAMFERAPEIVAGLHVVGF